MTIANTPPPRPSTTRLSVPPVAAMRGLPRPRTVAIAFAAWVVGAVLVGLAAALASTKVEPMRAEFTRLALAGEPEASEQIVSRVAAAGVVTVIGVGVFLSVMGLVLAGAMRAGRRWARALLALLTVPGVGYGVFLSRAVTEAMVGEHRAEVSTALLAYAGVAVVAAICMFLPGTHAWFHRPTEL